MSQNTIITVLTALFVISSIFGGSDNSKLDLNDPNIAIEQSVINPGQRGQILGDRVTLRTGPSTDHSAITILTKDKQVTVLDYNNGWYQVKTNTGQTGWVAGYLIEVLTEAETKVKQHNKAVMGYYLLGQQSYNSLIENSNSLTSVIPWSWSIDSYGGLNGDFDYQTYSDVLLYAGNQQLETYALIHNFYNDGFDSRIVSTFLNNPYAQERAINQIHSTLVDWGMTGINLDLENVPAEDRDLLNKFVAKLSEKLKEDNLKITMAVPAKTADDPTGYFGAYDYKTLGKYVDKLVIMAYDQHYRGGPPGPIASVEWVESVIKFAVNQVPANKIVLGIPNYGYDWPVSGVAKGLTYSQTMELAAKEGVSLRWDSTHKVPYFNYGNGRQVWFENRYSIKYKLDLVNQYNLGGIALWRLGQEDNGIWQVIDETLK